MREKHHQEFYWTIRVWICKQAPNSIKIPVLPASKVREEFHRLWWTVTFHHLYQSSAQLQKNQHKHIFQWRRRKRVRSDNPMLPWALIVPELILTYSYTKIIKSYYYSHRIKCFQFTCTLHPIRLHFLHHLAIFASKAFVSFTVLIRIILPVSLHWVLVLVLSSHFSWLFLTSFVSRADTLKSFS